jgi:hypothetical protein
MLKDGVITTEEAESLLNALDKAPGAPEEAIALKDNRGRKPKKLRVTVDAGEGGTSKAKVNINIPLSLLKTLGPVIKKSVPSDVRKQLDDQGIDLEAIMESVDALVESGIDEDIVNIDAGENGENAKVRVYVE